MIGEQAFERGVEGMGELLITSPKRDKDGHSGWEGFFPYYAGYPTQFATDVIRTAGLAPRSSVLDPWNGSGTTTYAASQLGHTAIGLDLNPVMIVIARARMLSPSEANSLLPLCSYSRCARPKNGRRQNRFKIGLTFRQPPTLEALSRAYSGALWVFRPNQTSTICLAWQPHSTLRFFLCGI